MTGELIGVGMVIERRSSARLALYCGRMGDTPWQGDACSLVDEFRAGRRSPAEELQATLSAIDDSKLNAFCFLAGDRKAALAAIPDEAVDQLVVHGSPAHCRATIARYFANGVTTTSLAILPLDPELKHGDAVRALAPSAG